MADTAGKGLQGPEHRISGDAAQPGAEMGNTDIEGLEGRDIGRDSGGERPAGETGPEFRYPLYPQGRKILTDGTGSSDSTQTSHQPSAKKDTICSPKCQRLNPAFAEHLMGLCPGWTSVSEPLEMGLYRQWRHSLSELLREN